MSEKIHHVVTSVHALAIPQTKGQLLKKKSVTKWLEARMPAVKLFFSELNPSESPSSQYCKSFIDLLYPRFFFSPLSPISEISMTQQVLFWKTLWRHLKILLHIRYVHYRINTLSEGSAFRGNCVYLKKIDLINSEKPSKPSNIKE